MTLDRPLRVAIIGAGPAGVYAADLLSKAEIPTSIDILERFPRRLASSATASPPITRGSSRSSGRFSNILGRGDVRLLANVNVGTDISLEDLRAHYDAVVFATGSLRGRAPRHPRHRPRGLLRRRRLRLLVRRPSGRPARVAAGRPRGRDSRCRQRGPRRRADARQAHRRTSRRRTCRRTSLRASEKSRRDGRAPLRPPRPGPGEVHPARAAGARAGSGRRRGRLSRGLRLRRGVSGGDRWPSPDQARRSKTLMDWTLREADGRVAAHPPPHASTAAWRSSTTARVASRACAWSARRFRATARSKGTGEFLDYPVPGGLPRGRVLGSEIPGVPFDDGHAA